MVLDRETRWIGTLTMDLRRTLAIYGRSQRARAFLLCSGTLFVAALVIARGIGAGEFAITHDEAFQASTGLYFASLMRDLPLRDPTAYTYLYYAHYPALALVRHPPLFYITEGLVFLIFGPSVIAARFTTLLFALFGLYFWFQLVSELQDERTAAITTVLVALLPGLLLYEKAVMIDVPALAMCLPASYFWIRYLREGTRRLVYYFAIFAALALLTKEHTAYLAVWCLLSVTCTGKWRTILNRSTFGALALSLVMVLPNYVVAFTLVGRALLLSATNPWHVDPFSLPRAGLLFRADFLQQSLPTTHPYLFYPFTLPGQAGWIIVILAILGVLCLPWWGKRQNAALILTWILACYITETTIVQKQARYIFYWLPPIVYLAIAPLTSMLQARHRTLRILATVVIGLVLACYFNAGWNLKPPYLSGYAQMARRLAREPGGYVLLDAPWTANTVFFVQAFDPHRRFVIDPKALYVTRGAESVVARRGYIELAHSSEDVRNIIRENGFRYVIVDTKMAESPSHEAARLLRNVLEGPGLKRLYSIKLDTDIDNLQGDTLILYENLQARPPVGGMYRLPMLSLNHDIVVPRAALGVDPGGGGK